MPEESFIECPECGHRAYKEYQMVDTGSKRPPYMTLVVIYRCPKCWWVKNG